MNRPDPTLLEFKKLEELLRNAKNMAYLASTGTKISYRNNNLDYCALAFISQNYNLVQPFDIESGRYFSPIESNNGNNVVILGSNVAKDLFARLNPIDKEVKIGGRKAKVIGLLAKQGNNIGSNFDDIIYMPLNYGKIYYNVEKCYPTIVVSAKEDSSIDNLTDELTVLLRGLRRLSPFDENNFALNRSSMLISFSDTIFSMLNMIGFVIGGFSILVGGFGIANIMFVSVKERTKQIGIQKAIGAKSYIILFQFLIEAIILCLFGGIIGLILVEILILFANPILPFTFMLNGSNILIGITISVGIGLISGFAPARKAAKLNPILAINSI
jgi:putative ABC transport system permease protein